MIALASYTFLEMTTHLTINPSSLLVLEVVE
jgi:hypothetical protein